MIQVARILNAHNAEVEFQKIQRNDFGPFEFTLSHYTRHGECNRKRRCCLVLSLRQSTMNLNAPEEHELIHWIGNLPNALVVRLQEHKTEVVSPSLSVEFVHQR